MPLTRSMDAREGRTRLRMPPGVRSPVPLLLGSMRWISRGGGRVPSTGSLRNWGEFWDVHGVGGAGRWSVSGFFGLELPDVERRMEGEPVEIDVSGPPWGPVRLHLTADTDLFRGEFDATATSVAGGDYHFRVAADEDGRADAGWWPAGTWTFRVHRSAESCTPQLVSVRPSTEPTVVEFAVENLLTR